MELKYRPYRLYAMVGGLLLLFMLGIMWIMVLLCLAGDWRAAGIFLLMAAVLGSFVYWLFRISKTSIVFDDKGLFVAETHPRGQRASFQWSDFCCAISMTTPLRKHGYILLMPQYDMKKAKAALKRSVYTDRVLVDDVVVILLTGEEEVVRLIKTKRPHKYVNN